MNMRLFRDIEPMLHPCLKAIYSITVDFSDQAKSPRHAGTRAVCRSVGKFSCRTARPDHPHPDAPSMKMTTFLGMKPGTN